MTIQGHIALSETSRKVLFVIEVDLLIVCSRICGQTCYSVRLLYRSKRVSWTPSFTICMSPTCDTAQIGHPHTIWMLQCQGYLSFWAIL